MNIAAIISAVTTIVWLTNKFGPAIRASIKAMEGADMPGPEKRAAVLAEIKLLPEAAVYPDGLLDTAIQLVFAVEFRLGRWMAEFRARSKTRKESAAAGKAAAKQAAEAAKPTKKTT